MDWSFQCPNLNITEETEKEQMTANIQIKA